MAKLLILLLMVNMPVYAEIYKIKNPDGSTSYSDVKVPGSKVIIPPKLTPTPAFKAPKKANKPTAKKSKDVEPYQSISIVSPVHQSIIRDNNGDIKVSFTLNPELQTDARHSITLLLNGKIIKKGLTSNQATLKNINRGSHAISAQIVDEHNKPLLSSSAITIHMKRHSILHKEQEQPNPGISIPDLNPPAPVTPSP